MGFLNKIKIFYNLYKARIIIAITIISILSVVGALKWYGVSEYNRGVESCTSAQKTATITTLQTDNKIWKEVKHETSKITDRVAAGAALGILRPDDVR